MVVLRILIVCLLSLCTCETQAQPSFACKDASNNIEKAICDYTPLGDLDGVLGILYKNALELGDQETLKDRQRLWLKDRPAPDKGDLHHALLGYYITRIKELLSMPHLKDHVAQKLILTKNRTHSQKLALSFIVNANSFSDSYVFCSDAPVMDVAPNFIVVPSCTGSGAYNQSYDVYELRLTKNGVDSRPAHLPGVENNDNVSEGYQLSGGTLEVDTKTKQLKYTIHYTSFEEGPTYVWAYSAKGPKGIQ